MSDLISRQDAIDAIENTSFDDYGDYMMVRELIEDLPSAEPKTGKWVSEKRRYKSEDGNDYTYFISHCSECGVRRRIGWQGVAFCPNCGARMETE